MARLAVLALLVPGGLTAAIALQGSAQVQQKAAPASPPAPLPLVSVADPLLITTWAEGAVLGPAVSESASTTVQLSGHAPPLHFTVQNLGDATVAANGIGVNVSTGPGGSFGFTTTAATASVTILATGGSDRRFLWVAR